MMLLDLFCFLTLVARLKQTTVEFRREGVVYLLALGALLSRRRETNCEGGFKTIKEDVTDEWVASDVPAACKQHQHRVTLPLLHTHSMSPYVSSGDETTMQISCLKIYFCMLKINSIVSWQHIEDQRHTPITNHSYRQPSTKHGQASHTFVCCLSSRLMFHIYFFAMRPLIWCVHSEVSIVCIVCHSL